MIPKKHDISKKLFVIKVYSSLSQIESIVSAISEKQKKSLQLSILGKFHTNNPIADETLEKVIVATKQKLSDVLMKLFQFGYFIHPEIGLLFIAGHLTPTFLNKVDDRELASLPAGLLGIFKGLDFNSEEANCFLNALKNEDYCLIIRGERSELSEIEPILSRE